MPDELSTELKTRVLEKTSNVSPGQANAPSNTQARLQAALWMLCNILIKVSEVLNKARSESNLASIKAGFNSADETAKAGLFQLGGGAILAGTGGAQGVAGCKSATELAEATELRNNRIACIKENITEDLPAENPEITIQVEALDEPTTGSEEITEELPINAPTEETESSDASMQAETIEVEPVLDEMEEEVLCEEALSSKQAKSEEQAEKAQTAENVEDQKKLSSRASKEEDKLIRRINKEYDVEKDLIQAKTGKMQGLAAPGQGFYHVSQGLGDVKRSQSQKETINEQTQNKTLEQIEKTTDGLNREIDKLSNVDTFKANSGVIKG